MAPEAWLIKVKKTISQITFDSVRTTPPTNPSAIQNPRVGILAFEVAGNMQKLTHMWRFLSDENIAYLRNQSVCLQGVHKVVSNKDAFLLGLARAEMVENLRLLARPVCRLSKKCQDSSLRCFETAFVVFANAGHDLYGWSLNSKDMQARIRKMERYVAATTTLHKEMQELISLQYHQELNTTKQQKIYWQQQEVKYLKHKSLWNTSFDVVTSLLATSIFTMLARIKLVFGIPHGDPPDQFSNSCKIESGPLIKSAKDEETNEISQGFFEANSKMLKPASNTLGYAALSLHYANLIIVMEKMIRSPHLVGLDARDGLYSMLPNSIRSSLRGRLKGIGFTASDPVLAGEWREALGMILGWLSPLAHNMIKWQNERSLEHQNIMKKTNVLLLQTLFFANRQKTEAAITELLVGLNYILRYEREMNGNALFNCIIPAK